MEQKLGKEFNTGTDMAYELPPLPYPKDALEPFIDAQTMEIHHGKHHATYVSNLNAVYRSVNSGASWAVLANVPNNNANVGRIALAVGPSASTAGATVKFPSNPDNS